MKNEYVFKAPKMKEVIRFDEQAIFNRVAIHLLSQRKRASIDSYHRICRMRVTSPDGEVLACSIGCVMPDSLLLRDPGLNATRIPFLNQRLAKLSPDFTRWFNRHDSLLVYLFRIHDFRPPCNWPDALEALASLGGLDYSVVTSFKTSDA